MKLYLALSDSIVANLVESSREGAMRALFSDANTVTLA